MAGWSHDKRVAVERAFYQFLDQCFVASKDVSGEVICLGTSLYEGQRKLITDIFDGLEDDIHDFYILKSRQLGISTITPPGGGSLESLFISEASPALFWATLKTIIEQQLVEIDAAQLRGRSGFGR